MITFVQRCVFKYLAKQQTGGTEIDIWDFENEKIVWNEFMEHYTKLIIDEYATFFYEYSYYLEVSYYFIIGSNVVSNGFEKKRFFMNVSKKFKQNVQKLISNLTY